MCTYTYNMHMQMMHMYRLCSLSRKTSQLANFSLYTKFNFDLKMFGT